MVEWEYLQGRFVQLLPEDSRLNVSIAGTLMNPRGRMTLDQLGLEQWELVSVVPHGDELLCFFKRQKLYQLNHEPR
jgi:hypothetical protein